MSVGRANVRQAGNRGFAIGCVLVAALIFSAGRAGAQAPDDPLASAFRTPPASAKPRVWWHWMNGNVTREGITADLEWMNRVGIGGMQMFEIQLGVPQFTGQRLVWMTPAWRDALRHAATEAKRLGLEMTMEASAGWGQTGGPWVKPEEAMKKVVWSETSVTGPANFDGPLPLPPGGNGPFRNYPAPRTFTIALDLSNPAAKPAAPVPPPAPDVPFYRDSHVLAFRVADDDRRMAELHPRITTSAPVVDAAALVDGDISRNVGLDFPAAGGPAWVQFEFAHPVRFRAFTIAMGKANATSSPLIPTGEVQASQDGKTWVTLLSLPGSDYLPDTLPERTYSHSETTAKYYRVSLTPPAVDPSAPLFDDLGRPRPRPTRFEIAELEFHPAPRVHHWQEKAAFANLKDVEAVATPAVLAGAAVELGSVIDLTTRLRPDGSLSWDVPPGRWQILRLGYSLTGKKNHPAPPESTGYEVDKLSRRHVESYLRHYVRLVSDAVGDELGGSLRYFLLDSWEAGFENWTDDMVAEFRARRGYDPVPYLPVLTGRVVESADVSDRFLWDYRRTIADLLSDNFYGTVTEFLHRHNVGLYAEAGGIGGLTTADGLQAKGRVEIPMGEFWTPGPGESTGLSELADVREAASAGHIYGKPVVAAESFTSWTTVPGWGQAPADLKPLADRFLALGINRIVFHTSAHQPFVDDGHQPGLSLWAFGQHYSRNITWAEQAVAWNTYLARCCHLLQQGLFVGDVACFYGEGAPRVTHFHREILPAFPPGYQYDYLNAEVLLTRMSVKEGRLVLPDGMSYRVLVLPASADRLTLAVLEKLRDLIAAGATVLAPRPKDSPGLRDHPTGDAAIRAIADEVWGDIDGKKITRHAHGRGTVFWGVTLQELLTTIGVVPDLIANAPGGTDSVAWTHRRLGDADLYFIANRQATAQQLDALFRVDGKAAEFWQPDTGRIEPAAYRMENGQTRVPVRLDPHGSVFVVFRDKVGQPSRTLPVAEKTVLATLAGPWTLCFPPHRGAPPAIQLDRLDSWTLHADDGVKYFSGTATYARKLECPPEWLRPGARLWLDLGRVKEIAEVTLNGRSLGILWKPPFSVEVTEALHAGENQLEIKVTNLWPNRIIGDQQPTASGHYTFTVYKAYGKDAPLLESGLLGPVTVSSLREQ